MKCPSRQTIFWSTDRSTLSHHDSQDPASFKSCKNVQQMVNHFWKRLVKGYLPTPLKRSKWSDSEQTPLRVNDFAWILKDMTPRGICSLGLVLEVYPGRDGQHRVVKTKTAYGTYVRPVSALAHVFSRLAHFFLTFFRSGSLVTLGYTLFVDLVKRLWCVSWPPLSLEHVVQRSSQKWNLKKHWPLSLSRPKTSWLFPQLKTD